MPTYLIFFETEIISHSDIGFNYLQRNSVIANKTYCSFLKKEKSKIDQEIQNSISIIFPESDVIEFGKVEISIEHKFTIFFILFRTNDILFENGEFYSYHKIEEKKEFVLKIRNYLSQSIDLSFVKRLLPNIFIPEKLKHMFRRKIEGYSKKSLGENWHSIKAYYQNYVRFPFLIEFQTTLQINFEEKFNESLKEYYTTIFPIINEATSLFAKDFSFFDLKSCSIDNFETRKIAEIISKSLLEYIHALYVRIIDNLAIYRKRIALLSERLTSFPRKTISELNYHLKELQGTTFEEYPLLFINVLDRYIIYEEDEENPDLTEQIFGFRSQISNFRRNIQLLNEKITNFQSEIRTLILTGRNGITSFSKEELVKKLDSIQYEQDFRKEILIPILSNLGFNNIQEMHGQYEYGVDILFSNENKFNIMEWNAIVAKVGDINLDEGTEISQNLKRIFTQVYQAKSMNHLEKNYDNVKLNRVFIATNGKINFHAKNALFKKEPLIEGNIFFIDYNVFLDLF